MVRRCPRLSELPPPPPGLSGWPWTEETPPAPDVTPGGGIWPRISVVTPCFNHREYIEETLRSVLLQGYPDLELIVMDGGSTDGSVEIIDRYAAWLGPWVSERDRNSTEAVNKGVARATGALIATLPSDDLYAPGALRRFAEAHLERPEALLLGAVEYFWEDGRTWTSRPFNVTFRNAAHPFGAEWRWQMQGMMVPRAVQVAAGPLDERSVIADDQDWLCRVARLAPAAYVDAVVARFRVRSEAKSAVHPAIVLRDHIDTVRRHWRYLPDLDPRYLRAFYLVHEAAIYLAQNPYWEPHWDRGAGLLRLARAGLTYPRIVAFPLFRSLVRRALVPRGWHRSRRGSTTVSPSTGEAAGSR